MREDPGVHEKRGGSSFPTEREVVLGFPSDLRLGIFRRGGNDSSYSQEKVCKDYFPNFPNVRHRQ